jgi:hypothetical protein
MPSELGAAAFGWDPRVAGSGKREDDHA